MLEAISHQCRSLDPEDENSINPYDFEEIKVDGCFTPPATAEELCQPGFLFPGVSSGNAG